MTDNFKVLHERVATKVSRPLSLSDPDEDFQAPVDCRWREETVAKAVEELSSTDLQIIFQSIMPAGTFEECLYYYPFALERFSLSLAQPPQEEINADLLDNLLAWTVQNQKRLEAYGLLHLSMKCILDIYAQLFACNQTTTCECLLEVTRFLRYVAKRQWYHLVPQPSLPYHSTTIWRQD